MYLFERVLQQTFLVTVGFALSRLHCHCLNNFVAVLQPFLNIASVDCSALGRFPDGTCSFSPSWIWSLAHALHQSQLGDVHNGGNILLYSLVLEFLVDCTVSLNPLIRVRSLIIKASNFPLS